MTNLKFKTLYIEITHACNQMCKHCYLDCSISKEVMPMSLEQIKKAFLNFKDQGGQKVIITGGEPFVRKDIFDILDYLEELHLFFDLASNSLAMNKNRLERLSHYKYFSSYFTSLLGATKEKHKYIANQDSFNKVLNAIKFFNDKEISTYVQVTLASDFLGDIDEILDMLIQYNKCIIKFTPIASMGIKKEYDKNLIVPKQKYADFLYKIKELQKKYPNRIDNCNLVDYEDLKAIVVDYQNEELWSLCYQFVVVRPNGDISFSTGLEDPYVLGKAFENLYVPIVDKLKEYIIKLKSADYTLLEFAKKEILEYDVELVKEVSKQ